MPIGTELAELDMGLSLTNFRKIDQISQIKKINGDLNPAQMCTNKIIVVVSRIVKDLEKRFP